ncbi:MAG TPA: MarR family winged helix-turn-helix transcriptional regulator [Actinoallomurus sp.]|nr:MarR family winged helix-turn-helix transcriptional regulator [Actinoallomurus sp.]
MSFDTGPFDNMGEVLMALGGRLTRLQTEILASLEQPLTIRQYRILSRVGAGHTSLTALCKLAHRNPSTMSESVDKLVTQGFLIRGTSDTSRRTMHLELTVKGRNARDAADRAVEKFTRELTVGIPPELQQQILPVLTNMYLVTQADLDDR